MKFSLEGRRTWRVFPYFAVATAATVAFSLLAAASNNKWLTGYVLYSLIAVFGLIIPNALAYWRKTDAKFSTLFFTLRTLERRLHLVAIAIAAGLMILLFHLAIYPWPDLARDSASYAGLAAASCLAVTFTGLAARAGLAYASLEVDGDGVAGMRTDGRFGFTRLLLRLEVEIDAGDEAQARELAEKAEETCLVSASLDLPVETVIEVRRRSTP